MATGVELAVGYVTLTTETKGLARDVARAFTGVQTQAGRAGQAMGTAMTRSFNTARPDMAALGRQVEVAQQRITASAEQSATKQEAATRKVAIAQAKLTEATQKHGTTSSQALSAADRLATAQQRLEAETLGAASSQDRLQRELKESQAAVERAAGASETASRTYADGWKGVGQRVKEHLSRGVHDATQDAETQAKQGGTRGGSVFATAFKAGLGLMAAKFSVDAVVGGIKDAIGGAGDIEQSIGAIGSVFKTSEGQMLAWSQTAAKTVGLSSNDYNELATVLGAQLKNAGVSLDQVGSKANGLITTGADLSSMFGGTAAEAVGALSSALKGEMDPIEKYGISLNEAALKAQAMSMGLLKPVKDAGKIAVATGKMELAQRKYNDAVAKSGADSDKALAAKNTLTAAQNAFDSATTGSLPPLDAQTKAMAVMAAIEKQSADAKGNFAKEEDTFSHKQQVAAAQWENISTKIGGFFLPAATAAFGFIGDKAMPILDSVIGGLQAFGAAFSSADNDITSAGFAGHMERFGQIVRDNSGWITALAAGVAGYVVAVKAIMVVEAVGKAIKSMAAAQWGLNAAMSANPIGIVVAILVALVAGFILAYNKIGWFKDFVDGALKAVGGFFTWLWQYAIKPAFDGIMAVVGAVVNWFQTTAMPIIKTAVDVIGGVFAWLWNYIVKPYFGFIQTYISVVFTVIKAVFQLIVAVVTYVLAPVFMWLWQNIIQPVFKGIGNYIGWVWNTIITPIFNAIKWYINNILAPVFTWLWQNIIKPAFDGISSVIKFVWEKGIKPVFDFLSNAIKNDVPAAFKKGVDAVKAAWESIQAVAKKPVLFVIEKVINEGLIGAFNSVAGFIDPKGAIVKPLGTVKPPAGWATGGWTGPGARLQPAGIVHADEFVVKKSSRRSIEGRAPGLLDAFNQHGAGALGMLGFANGGRVWPTKSKTLTQGYSASHDGIDIGVPVGTPVYATGPGVVDFAGVSPNLGNVWGGNEIRVMGDGLERWFSHLSQIMVRVGQKVSPGQQIGLSGNSGITSGPHLHFGVYQGGYPNSMNPLSYLAGASAPSGGGGGFNPVAALVGMAKAKLTAAFPGGGSVVNMAIGAGEKLIGGVGEWVKDKLGSVVSGAVNGVKAVAGDVGMRARWMPMINAALIQTGHGDLGLIGNSASMYRRMMQESGGDPNAVNNWDSNAAAGQPSKGLMQLIPSTFEAYRDRGLSADIFNPMANMVASIRYTQDRYGDLRTGWDRAGGYSKGGLVTPTLFDGGGWLTNTGAPQIIDHQRRKPDAVLTNEQWRDVHTLVSDPVDRAPVIWNVQLPPKAGVNEFMDAVSHVERVKARGGARR
ncbi:hypothetical protein AL755_08485 [Arthrobacter sp. ERGS1:01]|uniref:peptidoglycan DD-metalloendopeptidase family protein n=1 Tax=Arthrobacter sp. ERGS1:01 TaxID=1704044 RepID=UPI0006B458FF|nr:peptidoglycan DD-metalloendopeptidase family protein [Arthrobacter sp. ERGS1:01]ALE05507.1 hypothetical protein AL755_08485 [Arthrobacter sp. ERGS1:01]